MISTPTENPVRVSSRRAQTRERLLDAALTRFAESGVLGASVEEVCEAAGFTRGAFYSNFASRDELCLELLRRECHRQRTIAESVMSGVGGPTDDPDAMIGQAVAFFVAAQVTDRRFPLVFAELRLYLARDPRLREAYVRLEDGVDALLASALEATVATAGLRFRTDTATVQSMLKAVVEGFQLEELVGRVNRDDLAHRLSTLLTALLEN